MTNEKSIKLLSDLYEISRGSIYGDAVKNGLAALEKQIPKKPTYQECGLTKYWCCPICGEIVLSHIDGFQIVNEYNHDICGGCGQAIDWSEVYV